MEKNLEVAVHSIKTFHEQQKKLYDEFVRLRMKYDRLGFGLTQKASLLQPRATICFLVCWRQLDRLPNITYDISVMTCSMLLHCIYFWSWDFKKHFLHLSMLA